MAFLRVVSGLGVGIVSDGLPVAAGGVTGGEIAHVRVSSSTRQCLCGDVGCWINEADNDLGLPAMLRNLGAPVRSMADVRAQMSSRTALTLKAVQDFGVSLGRHLAVMFLNLRPRVL